MLSYNIGNYLIKRQSERHIIILVIFYSEPIFTDVFIVFLKFFICSNLL